jgi:hypothetical protein
MGQNSGKFEWPGPGMAICGFVSGLSSYTAKINTSEMPENPNKPDLTMKKSEQDVGTD